MQSLLLSVTILISDVEDVNTSEVPLNLLGICQVQRLCYCFWDRDPRTGMTSQNSRVDSSSGNQDGDTNQEYSGVVST